MLLCAAGGDYWPLTAYRCPSLETFTSIGGGAHWALTTLCPPSPSLEGFQRLTQPQDFRNNPLAPPTPDPGPAGLKVRPPVLLSGGGGGGRTFGSLHFAPMSPFSPQKMPEPLWKNMPKNRKLQRQLGGIHQN